VQKPRSIERCEAILFSILFFSPLFLFLAPAILVRLSSLPVFSSTLAMALVRGLRGSYCILAALLVSGLPVADCLGDKIRFTYQSYMNDVNVWFTMFTLCLAPLVSHIALGLPRTVIMDSFAGSADIDRPSKSSYPPWIERVTLFNPVTIVWRYYAIAYFSLRYRSWDSAELAAVNAAFWDPATRRWDGTEATVLSARNYLTNPPETSYVKVISGSTLATVVLTLQGVQTIFLMISVLGVSSVYGFPDGLPYIFMPIGLLGLVRLPAAAWVSSEWGYDFNNSKREKSQEESSLFRNGVPNRTYRISRKPVPGQYTALEMRELPDTERGIVPARPAERRQKLLDIGDWKCHVYRAWWIISVVGLAALGIKDLAAALTPYYIQQPLSVSILAYLIMYLELCGGFLFITPVLVLRRNHASTLIPCLQSWWYKLYTGLMVLTALTTLVFASLETVRLPDGGYMSSAPVTCEWDVCEPWNKTAVLEIARWEWERYFNMSHIGD
jgi:hypothetical protein